MKANVDDGLLQLLHFGGKRNKVILKCLNNGLHIFLQKLLFFSLLSLRPIFLPYC